MEIQLHLPQVVEAATKKQNDEKAKALFGNKGDAVCAKLKELSKTPELMLPKLTTLLAVIEKASVEEANKMASLKVTDAVIVAAKRLSRAKTLKALIEAHSSMRIPKVMQDLYDAKPQWGLEKNEKDSPKVEPGASHGNPLRKMEYVKETKAQFAQHIKDWLLRSNSELQLNTKSESIKDPADKNKKVSVTSFYINKKGVKRTFLVGRWQVGGRGWHYDRLPVALQRARTSVIPPVAQ